MMPTHMNLRWTEMEDAMSGALPLRELSLAYGIADPFADNNVKALQIAVAVGLELVPGRTGPDARDRIGNEYEIKTIDIGTKAKGFSTNHHLTTDTIDRFSKRRFVFAVYEHSTLLEAYLVMPNQMNPIYRKWRMDLRGRSHMNNPKIPLDYVRETGEIMYLKDVAPPWADKEVTEEVVMA